MNRNNYRSLGKYCDNNALCGGYDYGNIQSYEFAKCNTIKENYDNKKYKVITNPFFKNTAQNSDFREQYTKGIL
jgi:hypothetical protein